MISEPMLEDSALPPALWHFVVNQPSDRQRNPAEDQQGAEWLKDQPD